MAFEIIWSKRADREIDDIIEYLAKEWSYRVKNNFIENFYNKLDLVSLFPDLGVSISRKKKIRGILIYRACKNVLQNKKQENNTNNVF